MTETVALHFLLHHRHHHHHITALSTYLYNKEWMNEWMKFISQWTIQYKEIHSICDNINKQFHMENITHYLLDTPRTQTNNPQSICHMPVSTDIINSILLNKHTSGHYGISDLSTGHIMINPCKRTGQNGQKRLSSGWTGLSSVTGNNIVYLVTLPQLMTKWTSV